MRLNSTEQVAEILNLRPCRPRLDGPVDGRTGLTDGAHATTRSRSVSTPASPPPFHQFNEMPTIVASEFGWTLADLWAPAARPTSRARGGDINDARAFCDLIESLGIPRSRGF